MSIRSVHVIINPAVSSQIPVLNLLNSVFCETEIDWNVSVTKKLGDGRRQAQQAVAAGVDVVAAYGGDGTIAEVASGLLGSSVPLAILPGGTANVMAQELGIPTELVAAAQVACGINSTPRLVDAGSINDHHFFLRVGIGFEAAMIEDAAPKAKARYGVLAYLWSALQNLYQPEMALYQLTLDGEEMEIEGVTCMIANSGHVGQADVKLVPTIRVDDGLLDVIVIQRANLQALLELLGTMAGSRDSQNAAPPQPAPLHQELRNLLHHWQVRKVSVATHPAQSVQYDGEILGAVPITCAVLPQAVSVMVPQVVPDPSGVDLS